MSSPGALHAQGREQFRRKQYFDAYRCFLAAADKCTARDTLLLSKIYQSLSQTELILERVKDAIDSATKAIEYDPNNIIEDTSVDINILVRSTLGFFSIIVS